MQRLLSTWKVRYLALLSLLVLSLQGAFGQADKEAGPASDTVVAVAPIEPAPPLPLRSDSGTYVIGSEDVLAIDVWREKEISHVVPVRPDGKISLALIGDVQASGQTPRQLEAVIVHDLGKYITQPRVTVVVQEAKSQRFNVVGQVQHPGTYSLGQQMTVLDAIAVAGGFRDFAKSAKIYVLRTPLVGMPQRIPFNYKQVVNGKNPSQNTVLQARDTVVVP
jgi:polysaccharide export outer membrane protein